MSPLERNKIISTPEDVARLAELLSKCPEVTQFDTGEHKEAWALAHSFADIETMFRNFLEEELPKLVQAEGQELAGLLFEIGVDFQHILYHISQHQKFYQYLSPAATEKASGEPPNRA